jgi:hypothetical protein
MDVLAASSGSARARADARVAITWNLDDPKQLMADTVISKLSERAPST